MAVAGSNASTMVNRMQRKKFAFCLLFVQVAFVILYSFLAVYSDDPKVTGGQSWSSTEHQTKFPVFQDFHLLLFLGFGLVVAFLKRYACSAVGYNILIVALVLQWGMFVHEIVVNRFRPVVLQMDTLLNGDFCVAAVIISFGAVLGKLGPLQLLVMALVEVVVYAINRYIGVNIFMAADYGYSMYVHMFGAYFGMAVSRVVYRQHHQDHPQESRTYQSDVLSFVGTLFLWICFPALNMALAPVQLQQRAMMNTIFSLAACTLTTYIMTTLLSKDEKFGMLHLQNCVLSGGVAMGTVGTLVVRPYGAMLVGIFAAVISVLGFTHIAPCLSRKMKVHDTRGVHNVHGLPGIYSAVISIFAALLATEMTYGMDLYVAFPAMAPTNATTNASFVSLVTNGQMEYGAERTAAGQALFQALTLLVSLVLAVVGGVITGFLLNVGFCEPVSAESVFDDRDYWCVNEEGMPTYTVYVPPPPATADAETGTHDETVELKQTGGEGQEA